MPQYNFDVMFLSDLQNSKTESNALTEQKTYFSF